MQWADAKFLVVVAAVCFELYLTFRKRSIESVEYKNGNFYLKKGDEIEVSWEFGNDHPSMKGNMKLISIIKQKNIATIQYDMGPVHHYKFKEE